MKYQTLKAFEQNPSCKVYLVIMPEAQERFSVLQKISPSFERFSSDVECRVLFDALLSPSLFGGDPIILIDECENFKKKEADAIISFLEKNTLSSTLLLGAGGKTPLSKVVEKIGIVLDTSDEKPWDKEKRLTETLTLLAKAEGKWLAPDAVPLLFERLGTDLSLLTQEVRKLICYVGDGPSIGRSEIFRASAASVSETPWKMAEEIVWEGGGTFDAATFHPLLFSIRSQLQIGLKITTLLEEGVPPSEWAPYFPKIWPKTLEKRKQQAQIKGSSFFKKGLDMLFKIETLSRTGSTQLDALFDLLRGSLCK